MSIFWSLVGGSVVAGLIGAISAAVILLVGGLGALSALKKSVESLQNSHELLEGRVVREVKTRAALKAVEARTEASTVEEEARSRLAKEGNSATKRRPTMFNLNRR